MTIRWGILGAGKIASKWASDLPLAGNASLQAVWARDLSKAEGFAAAHGAVRAAESIEDLLGRGDLDAVYVASPNMLHVGHARLCLEAGLPVLVEKPFGLSRAEAESVAWLARSKKLLCMEALWTRFLPSFRTMLSIVDEGRIGAVSNVIADFGFSAVMDDRSRLWDPVQGGGSLLDIGVYPLFLARSLLGLPDRVAATMTRSATGVDAACDVELAWNTGATASLHSSFVENTPCLAMIEGETGMIVMERMFHTPTGLVVVTESGRERIAPPAGGHGYEHEIRHFGECLEQGLSESPLWSLADTLELAAMVDKVREAAG